MLLIVNHYWTTKLFFTKLHPFSMQLTKFSEPRSLAPPEPRTCVRIPPTKSSEQALHLILFLAFITRGYNSNKQNGTFSGDILRANFGQFKFWPCMISHQSGPDDRQSGCQIDDNLPVQIYEPLPKTTCWPYKSFY